MSRSIRSCVAMTPTAFTHSTRCVRSKAKTKLMYSTRITSESRDVAYTTAGRWRNPFAAKVAARHRTLTNTRTMQAVRGVYRCWRIADSAIVPKIGNPLRAQIGAHGFVLGSVLNTSFTTDIDTRRLRAIAAGFMPAWYDALIRLILPAGTEVTDPAGPCRLLEVLAGTAG